MKRRKFIKDSSFLLPSMMFFSSLFSCKGNDLPDPIKTDKKIVIIGAGIAGLAAAKYFKDRGIEVMVLEAQEKVGGRVSTDRSLGFAFDEGASWIHGPKNNPITELASSAGANTFLTDDNSLVVFDIDGSKYSDRDLTEAESDFENAIASMEGNVNASFEEIFFAKFPQYQNNRLWKYMLSAYLEFDMGGDINALSSLDLYDDEAFKGKDLIITNGYDNVANFLATGIDVRLNVKVNAIDYSTEKILIGTNQNNFEADYVIVTVPLGVLKKQLISFFPVLPSRIQKPIDQLEMGTVNKFLCIWDTAFWNTDLQYIGYTPETKGKFNYFLNVGKFVDTNALMTFTLGDYSKTTENKSDERIIEDIMEHLKTMYGNNIPNPSHLLRTKWNTNEFAFGSYSFATNGTRSTDFKAFEEAVEEKVFFAGEHTSQEYRGTVHGAYLSGIREAEKIIALF